MEPFLALITPYGGTAPPQPPLGIWGPNDPRPTPPIAGPGRPPGWGMANDPGYGHPIPPGYWGPNDPRPTNPIAGPGRPPWWGMANDPGYGFPLPPPGYWGPNDPRPTNPIAGPGRPPWWGMNQDPGYGFPIFLPPGGPVDPGYSPPWATPTPPTDPGYSPPWAQVPDLPDTLPPAQGSGGEPVPVVWKTGWTPTTGWVVVGIPTGPVPTPSKS
jgi:hypothetical protein